MTQESRDIPHHGRRATRAAQLREAGGFARAGRLAISPAVPAPPAPMEGDKPHYLGHRERLRARFLESPSALPDYELLELVLFAIPRKDVKPLAKALIQEFGSFPAAIAAEPQRLRKLGLSDGAIAAFKIVEAAALRFAKGAVDKRRPLGSWNEVLDYCRASMAFGNRESFRILFLDKKNGLIADEVQGTGTVDHTPVYPREVIRRALELSATAIVLVHNHPTQPISITVDHALSQ